MPMDRMDIIGHDRTDWTAPSGSKRREATATSERAEAAACHI